MSEPGKKQGSKTPSKPEGAPRDGNLALRIQKWMWGRPGERFIIADAVEAVQGHQASVAGALNRLHAADPIQLRRLGRGVYVWQPRVRTTPPASPPATAPSPPALQPVKRPAVKPIPTPTPITGDVITLDVLVRGEKTLAWDRADGRLYLLTEHTL